MNQELENAIEVVKANNRAYYQRLYAFTSEWVQRQMKSFSSEDLKKAFFEAGNEPPNQPNVFGAVFITLSKERAIYKHGVTHAKLTKAHARLLNTWISHEYRLKQQANSTAPNKAQTALPL